MPNRKVRIGFTVHGRDTTIHQSSSRYGQSAHVPSGVLHIPMFSLPNRFHASQRSRRTDASISDGCSPNNSDHLMSNVTCFIFIVVQFVGRAGVEPASAFCAHAMPCYPQVTSDPFAGLSRLSEPFASSVRWSQASCSALPPPTCFGG